MIPDADWPEQARRLLDALPGAMTGVLAGLADHAERAAATGAPGGRPTGTPAEHPTGPPAEHPTGASAEHPTGAPAECRWCPVCQLVAVLRGERPGASAVLADVLRTTADALQAFAAVPDPGDDAAGPPGRPTGAPAAAGTAGPHADPPTVVQRIDIA